MTAQQSQKTINLQPVNMAQQKFLLSTKKFILYSGSVGAGKSYAGCLKGFFINVMYPGSRGLICRKEATTLEQSTKLTLLSQIIPQELIVKFDAQKGILTHKTNNPNVNSTIVFSGLDKRADQSYPTKIASTEYTWIFFDEISEGELGDFQMLSTRLRYKNPNFSDEDNNLIPKQLFGATNPDSPLHWAYKFWFESNNPDAEVILTSSYDNPTLSKEYLQSLEQTLTGITKDRLLYGKWVQAEGIIFAEFDRERNTIKKENLPKIADMKYFVFAGDSNFPKPRAGLLLGFDGMKYYMYDEFYVEKAPIELLIAWILDWKRKLMGKPLYAWHDPSDAQSIAKITMSGIICEKANNNVIPGIDTVNSLFANGQLIISQHCINTLGELNTYHWKKGDKDVPEKENDHAMDALRYAVHSDMNRGKPAATVGYFMR